MMWKPSVNAIWLRAAWRFDASRLISRPALQIRLRGYAARCDGPSKRVVVSLVLVGVPFRERGQRLVEHSAGTEGARDRNCVARAGVRLGQRPAADARIELERARFHHIDERRAFRVPQLTNVEVPLEAVDAFGCEPSEQDVACRLHQPLALDD